jgi:pyridoxamine 5'-phosphate oxidase
MSLGDLRKEYTLLGLSEADLDPDPLRQFRLWFDQGAAGQVEPNAMTLATATSDGRPSARVVLLKSLDERGLTFFSSYEGRKARELEANPWSALLFYWAALDRQVRVEGTVARVSAEESDAYFAGRPRGSQLGACASHQSAILADRAALERRLQELEAEFAGRPVPRPPLWGGYRLRPVALEFWQGRPNRLHDRLRYRRVEPAGWVIERLSP